MTKKKEIENHILNTKKIKNINHRANMGEKLKNHERLWFKNINGVRKADLTFEFTKDELTEYAKCKLSVHFFAQQYCHIKREDGTIGPMILRDYQKDIIDLYTKNRFSILMASRQVGKCLIPNTLVHILDEETKEIYQTTFYELYYDIIRQERKLSLLEKTKLLLYRLYNKI